MAYFSGLLQRPLSTAAVVAVAAVSTTTDFSNPKSDPNPNYVPNPNSIPNPNSQPLPTFTTTNLSHLTQNPPKSSNLFTNFSSPVASLPVIQSIYHYAKISSPKPIQTQNIQNISLSNSETMYKWHLPDPHSYQTSQSKPVKSNTVIILLGWLGAKQKHLSKYAEFYTSRGFNVISFTFPLSDVLSYKIGGKTEEELENFAEHLASWTEEEKDKNLVFHTFSNTGWLTYGVILEKFRKQNPSAIEKIKGCIVDSAPVAAPDPQVWASGFSAAFLKKNSVATKGSFANVNNQRTDVLVLSDSNSDPKPDLTEAALLAVLERVFDVVLNLPSINRRLSDVFDLLSTNQPQQCPQLYIYSSSDRVIPSKSVESFVEKQRKAGKTVRSCDFITSPHVDHFRANPSLYGAQLTRFLDDFVCKEEC
ncbi:hypothetical protein LUZ60_006991 [Juncus effusus]|nr:hypothetical protein LUZ60_006991 [Juncus effusus]